MPSSDFPPIVYELLALAEVGDFHGHIPGHLRNALTYCATTGLVHRYARCWQLVGGKELPAPGAHGGCFALTSKGRAALARHRMTAESAKPVTPSAKQREIADRRAKARALRDGGTKIAAIAKALQVSDRTVRRLLQPAR